MLQLENQQLPVIMMNSCHLLDKSNVESLQEFAHGYKGIDTIKKNPLNLLFLLKLNLYQVCSNLL